MELKVERQRAQAVSARVSIAPLWNWKILLSLLPTPCSCFNRTFMELKALSLIDQHARRLFQSHLYGIESIARRVGNDALNVSIAPLWNWKRLSWVGLAFHVQFQSHLYGIERELYEVDDLDVGQVSIAPLWNWKLDAIKGRPDAMVVSIAPLWNWKTQEVHIDREAAVSIAPLWNWKVVVLPAWW